MIVSEIIGNLGADAEIRDFGGKNYVSFSVAHSEYGKDQAGNRTEQTVWISVLWYGDGGGLFQYLKKGTKVFVRGKQRVKLYADRGGNAQVAININANEVVLCGSKSESTQAAPAAPARQSAPWQEERPSDVYRESEVDDLPF
jgi:single-strand DNA-binding protein